MTRLATMAGDFLDVHRNRPALAAGLIGFSTGEIHHQFQRGGREAIQKR
jgi:hypothetical protein